MKKLLIVNNNMHVGGVQKALYNLLWNIHDRYEVTLLLFSARGEFMNRLPENVRVIPCKSLFRYLGVSQGECRGLDAVKRGVLAAGCKLFGRNAVLKLMPPLIIPDDQLLKGLQILKKSLQEIL
jgi:hypothetical protein